MSRFLRLSLPLDQAIGTSTRCYATKAPSSKAGKQEKAGGSRQKVAQAATRGSRGEVAPGDSRLDVIRKVLFESDPSDEVRLERLSKVIPSEEVHETISRAWSLHLRKEREAHESELTRKYTSMTKAIEFLKATDESLYEKAVGGKKFQNVSQAGNTNARLEGLVPREMRIPMERPSTDLWDSKWTAPKLVE